jgi:hypothetical protein
MPKRTANNGSFKPGNTGRPKGTPNTTTKATREAFQLLVDRNFDSLEKWIQTVAADDPHKAFGMVMDLASFCVPKLKAIEVTGTMTMPTVTVNLAPNGGPVPTSE